MVKFAHGYYIRGETVYFMGGEPPEGQFIYRGDVGWVPLPGDGYGLADKLIDGDVDVDGPVQNPPKGVPAFTS